MTASSLHPPPTPSAQAPQRLRWWQLGALVLAGAVASQIAGAVAVALQLPPWRSTQWQVFVVALMLGGVLQTLLHEAGHVLLGRLVGMPLQQVGIGEWRLQHTGERWQLRRERGRSGRGGFSALLPPARGLRRGGMATMLLGGVLANAAVTAALLAMAPRLSQGWQPVVLGLAAAGAVLVAINLLPLTVQGWRSDGGQLLDLLVRPRRFHDLCVVQRIAPLMAAGVRPRDWPADAVPHLPDAVPDSADGRLALLLACVHAQDTGDAERQRQGATRLAASWPDWPEAWRPQVALQMATYAALSERDVGLLEAWRPFCEGVPEVQRQWLEAERAWLQRRFDDAIALTDALRAVPGSQWPCSDPVAALLLRERLESLAISLETVKDT